MRRVTVWLFPLALCAWPICACTGCPDGGAGATTPVARDVHVTTHSALEVPFDADNAMTYVVMPPQHGSLDVIHRQPSSFGSVVNTYCKFSEGGLLVDSSYDVLSYQAPRSYAGPDSFTYYAFYLDPNALAGGCNVSNPATVYIDVVNEPPVAEDISVSLDASGQARITLRAQDADGDALMFHIPQDCDGRDAGRCGPQQGSFLNWTGDWFDDYREIVYVAGPDFSGTDSFGYVANDWRADSNVATVTVSATGDGAPENGNNGGARTPGSIVAWGFNDYYGECNVPAPNADFVAITAGYMHSLGLKADGSIVTWGINGDGQCNVAAPNTGFVAIAGGGSHSLGLRVDGSIVAWGYSAHGECNMPASNTGFVAVAGGEFHSLGLKADGSIVAWGDNSYGQCDVPAPNGGFVAVAGRAWHSLGLKADGSIVAWGRNESGQCNVPAPNAGFVALGAGWWHSLGLKADGAIVAWGSNDYGECNVPVPNTAFVAVAGGCYNSLGLKADGSVVAWGENENGECNVPAPNTGFVAVAAGCAHSLGLKGD